VSFVIISEVLFPEILMIATPEIPGPEDKAKIVINI